MAPAADGEAVVRRAHAQLTEEHVRHVLVVVLAGVDQHLGDARRRRELRRDDARLDELRTRADNGEHLHAAPLRNRSSYKASNFFSSTLQL